MDEEEKYVFFISELEKLSRKYGVLIGGCGCCSSPWLCIDDELELYPEAGYCYSISYDNVRWVSPKDKYIWNKDKEKIVKVII